MPSQPETLDVWITDSTTVYQGVPFTVITDWIQEGRLLGEDKVRMPGKATWHVIGNVKAFAPYFPQKETATPQDPAEALEPVATGFSHRSPFETEDDDVDMIPLIDVSLVLLVFFIMTAAVSGPASVPNMVLPSAKKSLQDIRADQYWVALGKSRTSEGVVERNERGEPALRYSFGKGDKVDLPPTTDLRELTDRVQKEFQGKRGVVRVSLRADRKLSATSVQGLTVELQKVQGRLNAGKKADQRVALKFFAQVTTSQQ